MRVKGFALNKRHRVGRLEEKMELLRELLKTRQLSNPKAVKLIERLVDAYGKKATGLLKTLKVKKHNDLLS